MIEHLRARLRDFQDQRNTIRLLRWQVDAHGSEIHSLRASLKTSAREKQTLASRVGALERHRAERRASRPTLSKFRASENAQLREVLRRSRAQKKTIKSLRMEVGRLRRTLRTSQTRGEASEARLARLRAIRKTLSASLASMDTELRRVLRRSRRQKATIKSLSREERPVAQGREGIAAPDRDAGSPAREAARDRDRAVEEALRAQERAAGQAAFGTQARPATRRARPRPHPAARARGAPRRDNPPPDACVCAQCAQPYAPNGTEQSTLVEIEVKAHKRVIRRPRWRRTCECAASPMEVSAPPVPRLFRRTLYGTSFWARFLFEHCACLRPVHRVAAWMSGQGLAVSPGTLANSLKRFVPLFEPMAEAILAHQSKAALRHAMRPAGSARLTGGRRPHLHFRGLLRLHSRSARKVAQPPKAAFVTGLRSRRLPDKTACQLPDQTDNCLGGSFLHWCYAPSGRTEKSGFIGPRMPMPAWRHWMSSMPAPGAKKIQPSQRAGGATGNTSRPSSSSPRRYAGLSAPQTPSSRSTPRSGAQSAPVATSPVTRPHRSCYISFLIMRPRCGNDRRVNGSRPKHSSPSSSENGSSRSDKTARAQIF